MPPTTNTGSFPGCLYTLGKQTNKKGIQTSPPRLTEHFNANINKSQGLSEDRKSTSFVCDLNIKLQLTLHLCTSIAEVFPAQEAGELTPSRCFHRTLSVVHRESPLEKLKKYLIKLRGSGVVPTLCQAWEAIIPAV